MSAQNSYETFATNLEKYVKAFNSKSLNAGGFADVMNEAYRAGTEAWAVHETPAEMAAFTSKLTEPLKKHFLAGVKETLSLTQNEFSRPASTMRDWVDSQLASAPAFNPPAAF
jgi:hypothetical protein